MVVERVRYLGSVMVRCTSQVELALLAAKMDPQTGMVALSALLTDLSESGYGAYIL